MHNLLCFQFSNEWNNIFVAVCICLTLSIHIIWRWWKYAGEVTMHISDRLTGIAKQGIPPTHWPSEFWSVYLQTFFFPLLPFIFFLSRTHSNCLVFFGIRSVLKIIPITLPSPIPYCSWSLIIHLLGTWTQGGRWINLKWFGDEVTKDEVAKHAEGRSL